MGELVGSSYDYRKKKEKKRKFVSGGSLVSFILRHTLSLAYIARFVL